MAVLSLDGFEPGFLITVLFIMAYSHIWLGDIGSGSEDLFFGSLGWLVGLPIRLLALSSGTLFMPLVALGVLAYIIALRSLVGEAVGLAILSSWALISLGV